MQFTAPRYPELVGVTGILDPQGYVMHQFTLKPLANLARGNVLAFLARKGGVVDLESHAYSGFVDGQRRQGFNLSRVTQCVGDAQRINTREGDNVAGVGFRDFHAFKSEKAEYLQYARITLLALRIQYGDGRICFDLAAIDTPDADDTDVAAVVERTDLHLKRPLRVDGWCRYLVHNEFE